MAGKEQNEIFLRCQLIRILSSDTRCFQSIHAFDRTMTRFCIVPTIIFLVSLKETLAIVFLSLIGIMRFMITIKL